MTKISSSSSDDTLERAMQAIDTISKGSKGLYMSRLRSLAAAVEQATGAPSTILRAVSRPAQTYAALTSYRIRKGKEANGRPKYVPMKPHTVHVTVAVAISLFKHFPELTRSMPKDTRLMWQNISDQTRETAVGKYEDLTPTQEQRDAYIPFDRIIKKRDELVKLPAPNRHQQDAILVLCLYSMFPPRRSLDWAIMSVFDRRKRADVLLMQSKGIDELHPNRMVIARNGTDMRVTFTRYKTAKKYGAQEFAVPAQLAAIVTASLKRRPRRFLFEHSVDKTRSIDNKRFSEMVGSVLRAQFPGVKGSPSIAMLRHSYIVAANVGALTPRVAKSLATQMGHSRMQQLSYAYDIAGENETGEQQSPPKDSVCRLTCS